MEIIIFLVVTFLVYFFPSLVATGRKNANTVFVLNLFLGWTFLGWVVALALAVSEERG